MSKISEEVHQVNTVIGNIKLLYQDEKQITDKIDSLEDNIDAVDLMYRGQKNKSLTKWAKIAAVILEGILAYRASKFIFEFLLGIRIDLKFANLIYLIGSFCVAWVIVIGSIGLLKTVKDQELNKKSSWVWLFPFLILFILPFFNIYAHFAIENDKAGGAYIIVAALSIIVNASIVWITGFSEEPKEGETLIQMEKSPKNYNRLLKSKDRLQGKLRSEYKIYDMLANDIEEQGISDNLPKNVKRIFIYLQQFL